MPTDVILGLQFGDEAKGKLTDRLAIAYDIVCKPNGGSNAGHTVVIQSKDGEEKITYKFHLIPSGIIYPHTICIIGNGTVINMKSLIGELNSLSEKGINWSNRLFVSNRAHIVMDHHMEREVTSSTSKSIGTTGRGIGPAYTDKAARVGLRIADLMMPPNSLEAKLRAVVISSKPDVTDEQMKGIFEEYLYYRDFMRPLVIDTVTFFHQNRDKRILVELSQSLMLCNDFGTYPNVTSSNCSVGVACTGLSLSPLSIKNVYGVFKAYSTRVGNGIFVTELHDEIGEHIRQKGREFGTTTGRPRRCGYLDVPQLLYSQKVNSCTGLCLAKLDVLSDLKELKVCTQYLIDGQPISYMPATDEELATVTPVYEVLPGFGGIDISKCQVWTDLPKAARRYIKRVYQLVGVPINWVGVGPSRDSVIEVSEKQLQTKQKTISFATSSDNKVKEVSAILEDINVVKLHQDLSEVQGSLEEIVLSKITQIKNWNTDQYFLVEDTSFEVVTMGNLPGPYIKHFIESMGLFRFWEQFSSKDKNEDGTLVPTVAYAVTMFGIRVNLAEYKYTTHLFAGRVKGQLVEPRGDSGFGWDAIFQPDGFDQTFAEMGPELKNKVSQRRLALEKVDLFLGQHGFY